MIKLQNVENKLQICTKKFKNGQKENIKKIKIYNLLLMLEKVKDLKFLKKNQNPERDKDLIVVAGYQIYAFWLWR